MRGLRRHRGHLRKHLQVLPLLFCFYNGSKAGELGSGEHQQSLSVNLLQPGPQVLEEGNGALRAQRWVWKITMQDGICYSDARVCGVLCKVTLRRFCPGGGIKASEGCGEAIAVSGAFGAFSPLVF